MRMASGRSVGLWALAVAAAWIWAALFAGVVAEPLVAVLSAAAGLGSLLVAEQLRVRLVEGEPAAEPFVAVLAVGLASYRQLEPWSRLVERTWEDCLFWHGRRKQKKETTLPQWT